MSQPLRLNRNLEVSCEVAWAMWTEPKLMRRWLFASEQGTLELVETDVRVGGRYRILEALDGEQIDHFGTYLQVDRPHRLVFTLDVPQHFPESTTIDVTLTPQPDGSLVEFMQTGIAPDKTRPFWTDMLRRLELATMSNDA